MNNNPFENKTGAQESLSSTQLYEIAAEARLDQVCIKLKHAVLEVINNLNAPEITDDAKKKVIEKVEELFSLNSDLRLNLTSKLEEFRKEEMQINLKYAARRLIISLNALEITDDSKKQVLEKLEEIFSTSID